MNHRMNHEEVITRRLVVFRRVLIGAALTMAGVGILDTLVWTWPL